MKKNKIKKASNGASDLRAKCFATQHPNIVRELGHHFRMLTDRNELAPSVRENRPVLHCTAKVAHECANKKAINHGHRL